MGEALKIIFDAGGPSVRNLAVAHGSVTSSRVVRLPVAIDSTVKRVDFILSTGKCDSGRLEVIRPDGSSARVREKDVEVIDIPAMKRVRIKSPAIGQWTMLISGKAEYDARVTGVSDIGVFDVSFYRFMPDSHWPVPDEVEGALPLNVPLFVETTIFGEVKNPTLDFILSDGSVIQSVPLIDIHSHMFLARYVPTAVTDQLFIKVTGKDPTDVPFERVVKRPFAVALRERHQPATKTPNHDTYLKEFYLLLQEERSPDEYSGRAWRYLYDLALADRLSLAHSMALDSDGRIAYRGASLLVRAGHEDVAIPLLVTMIADGRVPSQFGSEWGRGSSELLHARVMIKLSRNLLSQLEDYEGEERRRVEQFLARGETPFLKSSVVQRLGDEEEEFRTYVAQTNPFVNALNQGQKDVP